MEIEAFKGENNMNTNVLNLYAYVSYGFLCYLALLLISEDRVRVVEGVQSVSYVFLFIVTLHYS